MAATFIKSVPSMNGTSKPQTAGTLIEGAEWGIDHTIGADNNSSFIIQNESITEEVITDTTQDQKGAVVSQLDYDKHWTLTFDVIGDTDAVSTALGGTFSGDNDNSTFVAGDIGFEYPAAGGTVWKIMSVNYAGAYNDKKKWSVTAERWVNFPKIGG